MFLCLCLHHSHYLGQPVLFSTYFKECPDQIFFHQEFLNPTVIVFSFVFLQYFYFSNLTTEFIDCIHCVWIYYQSHHLYKIRIGNIISRMWSQFPVLKNLVRNKEMQHASRYSIISILRNAWTSWEQWQIGNNSFQLGWGSWEGFIEEKGRWHLLGLDNKVFEANKMPSLSSEVSSTMFCIQYVLAESVNWLRWI